MRVHLVHAGNRSLYLDEIEAMHRHRYEVFVEERGWRALESPDRLDIDEFDTGDASYLIAIDRHGAVMGSARLIPSWRPNMLKTLFPEYCAGKVPEGPGIWEWTRHTTPGRRHCKEFNIGVQLLMNLAILEFAQTRAVTSFIGILEAALLPYTMELGWNSLPLGAPRDYGEGVAVAIESAVRPGHLQELRTAASIGDGVLIEAPGFRGERGQLARHWLDLAAGLPEVDLPGARDAFRFSSLN
jgi:N-acyl-L-homoserine lactone synthetase